ncbi:hypothetical protein GW17_00034415 [Ensete ventricosum]|nr:hypothetical protein GW17_00034415 [Ensete ventricosum]
MLPLRFPNSDIRAKDSRPWPCHLQGWLATARPLAGAASCGQGPLQRGNQLQPRPPAQWVAAGSQPVRVAAACSAVPAGAASPQGAAASRRNGSVKVADKGNRRLCRGGDDREVRVREEG